MKRLILILAFLIKCKLVITEPDFSELQFNMTERLLNNYKKDIRPARPVQINVDFSLKKITELNERIQVLTTSSYLFVSWYDKRLSWEQSSYQYLYIPFYASQIWVPDLYVTNGANKDSSLLKMSDSSIVWAFSDGKVTATYDLISN